ncbi:MAG: twin-arginine translocase subunit TatB [Rhodobacterales bacterium]|nr:MAG: twin-arginine translocase subunit TatB [Rhodobacterales bacterium]
MFDLGWTELLLIGIVALIVVGPKDLPVLFRQMGRFMGKARAMAREFTQAMNDAADEAGVQDITKTMRAAANPKAFGADAIKDAVDWKNGPESDSLASDRAEAKDKIADATARAAEERKAREAARAQELADSAAEMEADLAEETAPATPPRNGAKT